MKDLTWRASRSSERVCWFQMSPAWQWSRSAAVQKAPQLPRSPRLMPGGSGCRMLLRSTPLELATKPATQELHSGIHKGEDTAGTHP